MSRQKNDQPTKRGLKRYNRTPLRTYYRSEASETDQKASPFKKRAPKTNHRRIVFGFLDIIFVALLLIGLIYSLLLTASPAVTVTDSSYHGLGTYKTAVNNAFGNLKNRNKISFDQNSIESKLQSQFPEIEAMSVELPFFSQQAKVKLIISTPSFLLASNNKAFVVDDQGKAVELASNLSSSTGLVTINDQTGFNTHIGEQVLAAQQVAFINQVIAQSQRAKVSIDSLTLPPLAQELDLRTNDQPYFVKFYLGGNAMTQTGQFLAARQDFASKGGAPSQYLDVRVDGKIFFK